MKVSLGSFKVSIHPSIHLLKIGPPGSQLQDDGKAMHGPVSVPPSSPHHSIVRSPSCSVLPLSLPRLLYSSWPLHNRTQIAIVLRRKRRAFLSLTRTPTEPQPAHASVLPPSVPPPSIARQPPRPPSPNPAGRASCAFVPYSVCLRIACVRQRRLFQRSDAP